MHGGWHDPGHAVTAVRADEIEFSDGAVIVADAEHLWQTDSAAGRQQHARPPRETQYWPSADVARIAERAAEALSEPDRLTGTAEVLGDVETEFCDVLYQVVMDLPKEGRVIRPTYRRGGREVGFWAQAYSRHLVYKALAERVGAGGGRVGKRRRASHDQADCRVASALGAIQPFGRGMPAFSLPGAKIRPVAP